MTKTPEQAAYDALQVILLTPAIASHLLAHDPKAYAQVANASLGLAASLQTRAHLIGLAVRTGPSTLEAAFTAFVAERRQEADQQQADDRADGLDADPSESYYGEGDAGRGAVQTTGEHLQHPGCTCQVILVGVAWILFALGWRLIH